MNCELKITCKLHYINLVAVVIDGACLIVILKHLEWFQALLNETARSDTIYEYTFGNKETFFIIFKRPFLNIPV